MSDSKIPVMQDLREAHSKHRKSKQKVLYKSAPDIAEEKRKALWMENSKQGEWDKISLELGSGRT